MIIDMLQNHPFLSFISLYLSLIVARFIITFRSFRLMAEYSISVSNAHVSSLPEEWPRAKKVTVSAWMYRIGATLAVTTYLIPMLWTLGLSFFIPPSDRDIMEYIDSDR